MLCRNCNNNLSGEEDFCPHCGIPQKITDVSSIPEKKATEEKPCLNDSTFFQTEPVCIYTDPPKEHKKSKAPFIFISVFIITLLIIGTVTLIDYFQLTPAFSDLFQSLAPTETPTTENLTLSQDFDSSIGTIAPDINFKSTPCTVSSEKGLTLRKGPDNNYAEISHIPFNTHLQIIGKSLQNDLWGYVYIPSLDLYGWLLCSYITEYSKADITDTTHKEQTTSPSEIQPETSAEKTSLYYATVTAEEGLYLRVGPGTDYEAIFIAPCGETVSVLDHAETDGWLYVCINNKTGYMNKAYLSEAPL